MVGIELTPDQPIDRVVELGQLAEREGFDLAFVNHHYNNRDAIAALTALAGETSRIELGPGVVNPYEVHPVTLASQVASIDEYSDGRAVFGLGAGDRSTLENLGFDRARPLERVLESVLVARRLFAGERVDHDGTFQARDASLNYDVSTIPLLVGAQGPDMVRMAAVHADGVLFNGSHRRDVAWAADRVDEGLERRSDDAGGFEFTVYASVSVADSANAARTAARPPVAFIAGGAEAAVLDRHDIDRERGAEIRQAISAGEFGAAADAVTDDMLDAFCIAGTPEMVADRLASLWTLADDIVIGAPLGPDPLEAIRLSAASVSDLV